MSKIILFKSQLQEYAQKASLPLPVYETAKEGPAHDPKFKATVIVNGAKYDSTSNFPSIKAAEQSAAQVALEDLLKKSDQEKGVSGEVNETGLCKNLLQVYAQRVSLPVPVYKFTRSGEIHSPVFVSTVEFAGVSYTGGAASTKKEAEIKAAQQALTALQPQACDFNSEASAQNIAHLQSTHSNMFSSQVPIFGICSQSGEDSQRKRSREIEVTSEECRAIKPKQSTSISHSTPRDEALKHVRGLYKNLLQEYTQKLDLALPVYTFSKSGEMHSPVFISTVQVSGISYTGGIANSKKEAASKAARKALLGLQLQACDSASQAPTQNILGCQAPNEDMSGSPVSISNTCSQLEVS